MNAPPAPKIAYLVFDTESVPDGKLLGLTKFVGEDLPPDVAIAKAQLQARETSYNASDFIAITYHVPYAIAVGKVTADFKLVSLSCLDAPQYRPAEMVKAFWKGLEHYKAKLVSFNGRGWDIPLLELAAFRYGLSVPSHFGGRANSRYRYGDGHLDLMEMMTNFGAIRFPGGLNLLSKLLGKPGKMETKGSEVLGMFQKGQLKEINDYCTYDVLDTYFIFLRTRVLTGELPLEQEQELVRETRAWLVEQVKEQPHLQHYLDRWGDWEPWP